MALAGLIAGGHSTFDSIVIGISSLFVRDFYARFIVRNASDAHYTRVGRILSVTGDIRNYHDRAVIDAGYMPHTNPHQVEILPGFEK